MNAVIAWRKMSKNDASVLISEWENVGDGEIRQVMADHADAHAKRQYEAVGKDLRDMFGESKESQPSLKYDFDLDLGLKIYDYCNKNGMTPAAASDDEIWIYMQVNIMPDLIYERWPADQEGRINVKRFYKNPWRIYLKTLWWYIHLSWAGSVKETYSVLKNNNVTDISHLVERTGSGFRVELSRAIMKRLGEVDKKSRGDKLINKIMKLNESVCDNIEPELMDCSLEEYIDSLFARYE